MSEAWPWLVARPIAHRGLHDAKAGVIENSVSAARAAIVKNFAIECDVQLSADGEAMVFHDFDLDRLTNEKGPVVARSTNALTAIKLKGSDDRIVAFPDFLGLVAGRAPLVCEIKSRFDGDMRLAERAATCVANVGGPIALKSFDPAVIAHLQANRAALGLAHTPLGMVAQSNYDDPHDDWARRSRQDKQALAQFLHWRETRPDFLSWSVWNLPHATPFLCRAALGLPVMTWTVRFPDQVAVARQWADQIIFEGDVAG
jgi:glycerophosphoryl diester phosphodiesterase